MFGLPQKANAISRTVTYGTQDAPTAQENRAVNWQVLTGMCLIGAPSLVAVGATGIVNADFCAYLSGGAGSIPAIEYGGLAVAFTGLLAGLPIAIERLDEEKVAKYARGLWFGVISLSALASLADVALSPLRQPPAIHTVQPVNDGLDGKIQAAQRALQGIPAHRSEQAAYRAWNDLRAANWDVWNETAECKAAGPLFKFEADVCNRLGKLGDEYWNARRAADLKKSLADLRAQKAATPVIAVHDAPQEASLADAGKTRLLWLVLAALRLVTASVGMWIATRYIASHLTGRTEFPRALAQIEPQQDVLAPLESEEEATLQLWLERCVSVRPGARVGATEAFSNYQTFCAANSLPEMRQKSFGARLTLFTAQNGGRKGTSNGNYYEGIALETGAAQKLSALVQ